MFIYVCTEKNPEKVYIKLLKLVNLVVGSLLLIIFIFSCMLFLFFLNKKPRFVLKFKKIEMQCKMEILLQS